MIESIVDLPQPLVPITVTNSFSAISKSTPSSATTSPERRSSKTLRRPSTASFGPPAGAVIPPT